MRKKLECLNVESYPSINVNTGKEINIETLVHRMTGKETSPDPDNEPDCH